MKNTSPSLRAARVPEPALSSSGIAHRWLPEPTAGWHTEAAGHARGDEGAQELGKGRAGRGTCPAHIGLRGSSARLLPGERVCQT